MVKGISLTLMIGAGVPIPVPKVVVDALTSVQVRTTSEGTSGFQLEFTLNNRSPVHTLFLLSLSTIIPVMRVIIIVTINGMPEVLMDGIMTNHEVNSSGNSSQTILSVTGEDLSKLMDYIDFSGIPYPAMPPEARIALIIAKYAPFGIVPIVIPSVLIDIPIPTDRIPRHQGTDLQYIRGLANEVGYVFYVDPGPAPGMSIAYWGPEIKFGVPQPALNTNMDAHTNVESINFSFNSEEKKLPMVYIHNRETNAAIPIPIPDITPLNPPLGVVVPIPKGLNYLTDTAKYSPVKAVIVGLAKASKTADVVSASGSLNVLRYGRILKARKLVGVRGAGVIFDGLYYVKSVTHNIKRGEYKQNFTLTRNALVSITPKVPV